MCCQQCSSKGTAHDISWFEFTQNVGLVMCKDGKKRMAVCIDSAGNTVRPLASSIFFGICNFGSEEERVLVCGIIEGERRVIPLFEPLQCINRDAARTVEEKLCSA